MIRLFLATVFIPVLVFFPRLFSRTKGTFEGFNKKNIFMGGKNYGF
ncbi:MAG: hypothetical protein SWO11_19735 [Thermodesulfobacteriota bacterium]|nr:hypothetical protein [Thermodesulfobacteriota bacterium]